MARWKLTEPHYLKVPGTKWEYHELDRRTGRPKRTQFDVPLHLDPRIEQDWTHKHSPDDGDIIVALEGTAHQQGDIIFQGPPTPGMLPLDDEAKAITEQYSKGAWAPTEGLEIEQQNASYVNKMLSGFIDEMTDIRRAQAQAQQPAHGMDEFMKTMSEIMMQQTQILTTLTQRPGPMTIRKS